MHFLFKNAYQHSWIVSPRYSLQVEANSTFTVDSCCTSERLALDGKAPEKSPKRAQMLENRFISHGRNSSRSKLLAGIKVGVVLIFKCNILELPSGMHSSHYQSGSRKNREYPT